MSELLLRGGLLTRVPRSGAVSYVDIVDGLEGGPPIAHWQLNDASGNLVDRMAGARHAVVSGTVNYQQAPLLVGSIAAVDLAGTGAGVVPHDSGLLLPDFSLSLWFRLNSLPDPEGNVWHFIVSKDESGRTSGDFVVMVESTGSLIVQFQSATADWRLPTLPTLSIATSYHLCIRADFSGFDAYLNGAYLGKQTSFTGAWSANAQMLRFGLGLGFTDRFPNAVMDEITLYDWVVTGNDVLVLAQRTGNRPVAVDSTSNAIPESATTVIPLPAGCQFIGTKAELTVTPSAISGLTDVTMNGDNDFLAEAGAVAGGTTPPFSLDYTIQDANGTSDPATISGTVQDIATEGGTLVYEFTPQASFIDGVPLTSRDTNDAVGPFRSVPVPNRWTTRISAGGGVSNTCPLTGITTDTQSATVCWNYAPSGEPSLEIYINPDVNNQLGFWIDLYTPLQATNPRHMRVVMEIKTSKASDPTTNKATGVGPTTGPYPDWHDTHDGTAGQRSGKYFVSMFMGHEARGANLSNWWGNNTYPISMSGLMSSWSSGGKNIWPEIGNFDRSSNVGGSNPNDIENLGLIVDSGVEGYWHRLEMEIYLGDPDLVPTNARRAEPEIEPSHTGDGFCKLWLTRDLNNELPGANHARQLIAQQSGLIFSPRFDDVGSDDNMHTLCTLTGPWINFYYGGSALPLRDGWAWIRSVKVFRHD